MFRWANPYWSVLLNSRKQTKTQCVDFVNHGGTQSGLEGRLTVTHWLVGYLSAPVTRATKRLPEVRAQLLINPRNMMHTVTYHCVRPLPDVQYDITCRATMTGNALPVIAFPPHKRHTAMITGLYSVPEGPWVPVYWFFR